MSPDPSPASSRALVVLNPKSSSSSPDQVRQAIAHHLGRYTVEIHELVEGEDLRSIVRDAVNRGVSLLIAAGGDGTVSTVADVLVGTDVRIAILPMGTANVLSRELGIPIDADGTEHLPSARLIDGPHREVHLDSMKVAGHHYFTQVGVGIDSLMIRDTDDGAKRRFGRAAYLWTAFTRLVGFQPRRFLIEVDGHKHSFRATQVVVANVGSMGQPPFRWGPDISPDDGRLDVCIVRARSMLTYVHLFWIVLRGRHRQSPHIKYLACKRTIVITSRRPLPVQADGEILGETPIEIQLVPASLRVIVPESTST
jgi:diacylglycerol kinase (ATP)